MRFDTEEERRHWEILRRGTSVLPDSERCQHPIVGPRCHRRATTYVDGAHLCGTCACRERNMRAWIAKRDVFVRSAHSPIEDELRAAGIM